MEKFVNAEAVTRSGERISFSFGKNWSKYIRKLSTTKVAQAEESLRFSFDGYSLTGESFLDIGCGSGVFSLAAARQGASQITSIDVDPMSIASTQELSSLAPPETSWQIRIGSVLDREFLASLRPATRVYSWGVLHHAGAMWEALENSLPLVQPGGALCIALYVQPTRPELHMALKRVYNRSPWIGRRVLELMYAIALLAVLAKRRRENPIRYVREYGSRFRGMSFWRDVEDWLGGLPCEWADPDDVRAFVEARGFQTIRVLPGPRGACSEFFFRRPS